MSSLFNQQKLETFKNLKKIFLKVFVAILIVEIVVWAIVILAGQSNAVVTKFQATFLVIAFAMFISMFDFGCIVKGEKIAQIFASISLMACAFWLVLGILSIWEVTSLYVSTTYSGFDLSVMGQIVSLASVTMIASMFGASILGIDEEGGPIRPLKITALVCLVYLWVFYSVVVFLSFNDIDSFQTPMLLSGLAFLALVVTWIAAAAIARSHRKEAGAKVNIEDNKEVQATIHDMVEKEVQARLEAERKKEEIASRPPLQDENMAPTVSHDNDITVESFSEGEDGSKEQDKSNSVSGDEA